MQAPEWFLKEMESFDPDLRLRWSQRLQLWQLERRVKRSLHPGTIRSDSYHDDFIRAQDGYLLVASIPPKGLTRSVFAKLRASDLWANGGWKTMADELDELDRQAEEKIWNDLSDDITYRSKELYDFWAIRQGRRILNAGHP